MRNGSTGMDFIGWIASRRGALGLVRGGRPRDIVDLLLETPDALPAIVGDRGTNEEILAGRVLNGGRRPRMHVSRGLRHDLTTIVQATRDGPVLVVPRICEMYIRDECDRVAGQVRSVAGYDAPRAVVTAVAIDRVAKTMRDCARHLTAPLLIHDAVARFPRESLAGFTVFGYPISSTFAEDTAMEASPPPSTIVEHARFLAGMEFATLKSMHAAFSGAADKPIFEFWDVCLARLGAEAEFAELMRRARTALDALQHRLPTVEGRTGAQTPTVPEPPPQRSIERASPAQKPLAAAPQRPAAQPSGAPVTHAAPPRPPSKPSVGTHEPVTQARPGAEPDGGGREDVQAQPSAAPSKSQPIWTKPGNRDAPPPRSALRTSILGPAEPSAPEITGATTRVPPSNAGASLVRRPSKP